MATSQKRSKRKPSGGRYKKLLVRRQHEMGGDAALTRIGDSKTRVERKLGGERKHKLLASEKISAVNPETGKVVQAEVENVTDNPANRNFIRRNILTKGTIVDTDKGPVRVTSRPGQTNTLQGVLLK